MSRLLQLAARFSSFVMVGTCLMALQFAGCERRERVLEIQTPRGDVTVDRVERDGDTRRIEVEATER